MLDMKNTCSAKKMRKIFILGALIAALLCGCAPQKNSAVGFHLDTVITATGYCETELLKEAIAGAAEYEALLSKTVEGSDVWRVNHANGKPVAVDGRTAEVLASSLEACALSDGAFDITIAPAAALWDFKSGEAVLPDERALAEAAALVEYTKLSLVGNVVTLPAGMQIDLGGVAKGYIAGKTAEYLKERGVSSAVLNFGGNVVALGEKPNGEPWSVGIQDPTRPTGEYLATVEVRDASVVTSGVYERGFDLDGVRYHHILDPATGWPVQNGLASVTIIISDAAAADALSTACFALGLERGMALASTAGAEAVFVDKEGKITCTDGIRDALSVTE